MVFSSSPEPKEFLTQTSGGKVMLMLFWDHQCPLVEHHMSKEATVTSALYGNLLGNRLSRMRSEHHGLVSTGALLLHDNRPHTAHVTAEMIMDIHLECLLHSLCSPDFAPCDYRIFGPLKEATGRKTFRSNEEVQGVIHKWLHMQPNIFFHEALVKHWRTCTEHNKGYVEK
jgi:hypothetical protein